MAIDTESGLRIFKAASHEALEETVNLFLRGDGTTEDPRKVMVSIPQLVIDGADFYLVVRYDTRTLNN